MEFFCCFRISCDKTTALTVHQATTATQTLPITPETRAHRDSTALKTQKNLSNIRVLKEHSIRTLVSLQTLLLFFNC